MRDRDRDEGTRRTGRRRRDHDHPESWIFGPRWKVHLDLFDSRTAHRPPAWRTGVGLAALVAVAGVAALAPASPVALTGSSSPSSAGAAVDTAAGLPEGTELRPTGKLVVTEDGAVVDGMDVRGAIWVQADGVRITNSRVVSGSYHTVRIFDGADGTVIEDSDVGCTDDALNGGKGVVFGNYTARRIEIVGCGTPFVTASGDVRVSDAVWNGRPVDDIAIGSPAAPPGGSTPTTTVPAPPTTEPPPASTLPPATTVPPTTTPPPPTTVPPVTTPTGGFPNASTTGPRAGVTLRPSGSINVTQDGAVIQNLHVTGTVTIDADDVTIRNTLIDNTGTYPIRITSGRNLVVEDTEIDGNGSASVAILPGGYTLRRVDIHDVRDGPRIEGDDVLIEDSYIHHLHRIEGGHHDAIQIRNGVGVVIRRNNLQAYNPATGDPMNAAIQIGSLNGPLRGLVVDGNLMNGGNYTINAGKSSPDPSYWRNNRFGRNFRYGVVTGGPGVVWETTNVYDDNGQPVR